MLLFSSDESTTRGMLGIGTLIFREDTDGRVASSCCGLWLVIVVLWYILGLGTCRPRAVSAM